MVSGAELSYDGQRRVITVRVVFSRTSRLYIAPADWHQCSYECCRSCCFRCSIVRHCFTRRRRSRCCAGSGGAPAALFWSDRELSSWDRERGPAPSCECAMQQLNVWVLH